MKRRILSILTALCLALTLLPTAVWATDDKPGTNGNTGLVEQTPTEQPGDGPTIPTKVPQQVTDQIPLTGVPTGEPVPQAQSSTRAGGSTPLAL